MTDNIMFNEIVEFVPCLCRQRFVAVSYLTCRGAGYPCRDVPQEREVLNPVSTRYSGDRDHFDSFLRQADISIVHVLDVNSIHDLEDDCSKYPGTFQHVSGDTEAHSAHIFTDAMSIPS